MMETVHIRCSKCRELIAVAVEDLGYAVQCPLCQEQFQAERAESNGSPPHSSPTQEISLFGPEATDAESIFAPEETQGDDIFGDDAGPIVQMPEMPAGHEDILNPAPDTAATPQPEIPSPSPKAAPQESLAYQSLSHDEPQRPETHWSGQPQNQPTGTETEAHSDFTSEASPPANGLISQESSAEIGPGLHDDTLAASMVGGVVSPSPHARPKSSPSGFLTPMLLVFLLPYSITVTIVLIYMLMNWPTQDPLERMLEEQQGKDAPVERVKHDSPLSKKLRVALNDSLEVGSVKVVPKKVTLSNLTLSLYVQLQNTSENLRFNPFPQKFATYRPITSYRTRREGNKTFRDKIPKAIPYVFLEGEGVRRVYGGTVNWLTEEGGERLGKQASKLEPGQSHLVILQTDLKNDAQIANVLNSPKPLLWRIHLRRGLEKIDDKDRSITCVVGIEFSGKQVTAKG